MMTYTTGNAFGPAYTPEVIRKLIMATCGITIFTAFSETLFRQIFGWPGLYEFLSLSWQGIRHYYLWQPLSYMFIQPIDSHGISIFFLLGLAFNMYILWSLGSQLLEQVGAKPFLRLYLISGIFSALVSLFYMGIWGPYERLAGPFPSILTLLLIWSMLNPETEMLLFFLVPVKAKWIVAGIFSTIFLITLSRLDLISLIFNLSAPIFGYLYAILAWDFRGPFAFTQKLDRTLAFLGNRWRQRGQSKSQTKMKIFDIKTGNPVLKDDEFIDAMLTKISKHGEHSLNHSEHQRMRAISEKKRNFKS